MDSGYLYAAVGLAIGVPALWLAKKGLRARAMRKYTGVPDLATVGEPRKGGKIEGTAVICGGSVAGLVTARVLSDHFKRVVVIEPDAYTFTEESRSVDKEERILRPAEDPVTGEPYTALVSKRSRVWQYLGLHTFQILLPRFFYKAFPNFEEEALKRGMIFTRADLRIYFGGKLAKIPTHKYTSKEYTGMFSSRRGFERMLRDLVVGYCGRDGMEGHAGYGNVDFIQGTVTAFNLDNTKSKIASVTYRDANGTSQDLESYLVCDCSGNTQVGLKLLRRAIPELPDDIRHEYNPKMYYQTNEIPIPDDFNEEASKLNILDQCTGKPIDIARTGFFMGWAPESGVTHRTLLLGRMDGNRMIYGHGGWDEPMPKDWDDCVQYSKDTEGVPEYFLKLLDILAKNRDKTTMFPTRTTSTSRIFYEKFADVLPTNFIANGDSIMRLNPRMGEGCTKSVLGAITLDKVLRDLHPSDKNVGRTYFHRLVTRTQSMWNVRYLDYGAKTTIPVPGESLDDGEGFRKFSSALTRVMQRDEYVAETFWKTMMFIAPANDMMAPGIILKVLKEMWFPSKPS